jgi:hypothetical protein
MTNAATVAIEVRPAQSMGVASVAAIGIGAMVGAGIFALIGQAALVAGQQVWISFLLGGVTALLSGYSFAKLSTRYASQDGALGYLNAGFSKPVAGTFALIYVLTLLVAVAMVARAFGAYAERLFFDVTSHDLLIDIFAAAIIVAMTVLNMASAGAALGGSPAGSDQARNPERADGGWCRYARSFHACAPQFRLHCDNARSDRPHLLRLRGVRDDGQRRRLSG